METQLRLKQEVLRPEVQTEPLNLNEEWWHTRGWPRLRRPKSQRFRRALRGIAIMVNAIAWVLEARTIKVQVAPGQPAVELLRPHGHYDQTIKLIRF